MSGTLKVNRLDSPLARHASAAESSQPAPKAARSAASPSRESTAPEFPRLTSASPDPLAEIAMSSALDALPEPPPLNEPLELISSRLPVSLRRSLSDLTGALRARNSERVSQKSLPEQEVLASLIWAAGSADDPQAVSELAKTLSAYRARRYVAAAAALRPS